MIVRVMTLLRGVLTTLDVDIAASHVWLPLALQTLQRSERAKQV
jgi:hypothetical protein